MNQNFISTIMQMDSSLLFREGVLQMAGAEGDAGGEDYWRVFSFFCFCIGAISETPNQSYMHCKKKMLQQGHMQQPICLATQLHDTGKSGFHALGQGLQT